MPNGDRIVALRLTSSEATIVTVYNKHHGNQDITSKIESLFSALLKMTISRKYTASDISTINSAKWANHYYIKDIDCNGNIVTFAKVRLYFKINKLIVAIYYS